VNSSIKKRALITGGTKGIGKAVATSLAQAGYDLLLTYASDRDSARQTGEELQERYGADVRLLEADITGKQSIDKISACLEENFLRLDAIVFNAGLTCRDAFETMSAEDWEKVFFGNVHFPVFLLQRIVSLINEGGCIVFTGSAMGIHPHAASLSYGVTKSTVHALVKNLVKTLVPYHIRVNAIAPGFVDTDWQLTKPADIRRNIESKIALGRFCEPEEIAEVYKMAIENPYLNGEIIVVDGGYSYK
jgi:3-oxoacyl-[acyl-carrier protein] reductase